MNSYKNNSDSNQQSRQISISINGQAFRVAANISVAAALACCAENGIAACRISVSGQQRGPFCGMGVCQECRVTINQAPHQLACQTMCQENMQIQTGACA